MPQCIRMDNPVRRYVDDAVQARGPRLKRRHESQNDCGLPESGGNIDSPTIVAMPTEEGYDSYFMIESHEHSAAEMNLLGQLLRVSNVTRDEIAFEDAANLHSAHAMGDAAG